MGNNIGNPNMDLKNAPKPGATSEIGKFRAKLGLFNRESIPEELLELYDWYKSLNTKEIDYILELKNIYQVLKNDLLKIVVEKMETGKGFTKTEIDQFRLAVDVMEKSHKMKFGDKKVIERIVTMKDVRNAIYSDRQIVDVNIIKTDEEENVLPQM